MEMEDARLLEVEERNEERQAMVITTCNDSHCLVSISCGVVQWLSEDVH